MSAILSVFIYWIAFVVLLYNFKCHVLRLRRGEATIKREMKGTIIVLSAKYGGNQIANSAVSYILIMFVLGLILGVLNYPMFWRFIWETRGWIAGIIVASVIRSIITMTVLNLVIKSHVTRRRYNLPCCLFIVLILKSYRMWAIVELILLYLNIAAGIMSSLVRFIKLVLVTVITLTRLDRTIFPGWVAKKLPFLDSGYNAYRGMVMMYHTHNHPIHITAAHILSKYI